MKVAGYITRYWKELLTLMFGVTVWLFWNNLYWGHLMYQEQLQLFLFDMDGTIADLYGVSGWLSDLENERVRPYAEARTLVDCERLIKAIMFLKAEGYRFSIISWASKNGSVEYRKEIRKAKVEWIRKYFPNCFPI